MDFVPALSRDSGVLSSLSSDVQRLLEDKEIREGDGAAVGSHQLAGRREEVQTRFAHTRFLLALFVQSQTRRGMISTWYQVGLEGRDTKSEQGIRKEEVKPPCCLHTRQLGAAQPLSSMVCTQGNGRSAHCTGCCARRGRWRRRRTPRRIGGQLSELSGPLVLPCPMSWGQSFPHEVVVCCSGDIPVQCSTCTEPILCSATKETFLWKRDWIWMKVLCYFIYIGGFLIS